VNKVYHRRGSLASSASVQTFKLLRARAADKLAQAVLRLPTPSWLASMATTNADRWLSELGL
jgi:hypothetical protein